MTLPCPIYGFVVAVRLHAPEDSAVDQRVRRSFSELLDRRGLVADDRRHVDSWVCAVRSEASQATDADRDAIIAWAAAQPEIAVLEAGPLADLGSDD
jgi:uncharacterized protein YggL (DUF469 family)